MSMHGKTPKSFNEGVEEASWAPLPTRHVLVLLSHLPSFGFFVSSGCRALEHSFELILLLLGQADSKGGDEPGYGFWYRVSGSGCLLTRFMYSVLVLLSEACSCSILVWMLFLSVSKSWKAFFVESILLCNVCFRWDRPRKVETCCLSLMATSFSEGGCGLVMRSTSSLTGAGS